MTLNSVAVSIASGDSELKRMEIGRVGGRSFSGSLIDTRRAIKREGRFRTTLLSASAAEALEHYLLGEGWHFPFQSDLYSEDTLLGPATGYTASLGTSAPSPVYSGDSYRLQVNSGTTLSYAAGLGTHWTLMAWIWNNDASDWEHHVRLSDDSASVSTPTFKTYKDGVLVASSTTNPLVPYAMNYSGANAQLLGKDHDGGGNENAHFEDFVVLPWTATQAMITAWAARTSQFSPLPKLDLGGTIMREATTTEVRATIEGVKHVQGYVDGAWDPAAREISFRLEEV